MSDTGFMENTQFLTFTLAEEIFAVDIARVREVLEFTTVTRVPRVPAYMRGVINLRGSVVPVVDLRLKFGMTATEKKVNTCIIITEVSVEGETMIIGALADSVQEVFEMDGKTIQPPPKIGTKLRTDFIRGMGKKDEEFVMILDIDKVFSADDLVLAGDMTEAPTGAGAETAQAQPPSSLSGGAIAI